MEFSQMPWVPLQLSVLNFAARRFVKRNLFPSVHVPIKNCDLVYKYANPLIFPKFLDGARPVFQTSGYPMLRQELNRPEVELQHMADALAQVFERADRIHFHTDVARNEFLKRRPEFAERVVTLPFFIPYLQLIDSSSLVTKFERNRIELSFVGFQGHRKGLRELCAAFDQIDAKIQDLDLHLTVVSRDQPSFKVFQRYTYHGSLPRESVQKLMADTNIFVLPTKRETYGIVFVEAMAKGCAIIADDDYPRKEILGDMGEAGVMVDPNNPELLAVALLELIREKGRCKQMGIAGVERVKKYFLPSRVAQQYRIQFQKLIDKKA